MIESNITDSLREALECACVAWSDESYKHELAGIVSVMERTKVGDCYFDWGFFRVSGGRPIGMTKGWPSMVEFLQPDGVSGAIGIEDAVELAKSWSLKSTDSMRDGESPNWKGGAK